MYIDWEKTIKFNPKFGPNLSADLPPGGIRIPSYGNYGGPLNDAGPDGIPVDCLDGLFKTHDRTIEASAIDAGGLTPGDLISAHADLIGGIAALDARSGLEDPEASLYAGLSTLALTAEVASFGGLEALAWELGPATGLPTVIAEAIENMEVGLAEVRGGGKSLHGALHWFERQFVDLLGVPPSPDADAFG
ncbi:hypothetical protein IGS68_08890 [Skermanella sp. TT6]|uniref:Uncharacterized protein n=1 Tax=Skermanella cutis TaxID=2775420 RepID=A0ABX7BAU4_9PROT|nr:hypothetical protein [Skermanella sp. TT6]QQP91302.1 hypothetical protein IGS68_08890 [Skermanella sp. TT6]